MQVRGSDPPDLSPHGPNLARMSTVDIVLVAAVLVGMSVQGAIGFGFAFFVAPAAFAAFSPEQAVTLVVLLGVAINLLVLFTEDRPVEVAGRQVSILVVAAVPGMAVGALVLTEVDGNLLQALVGVIVLAGAALQWSTTSRTTAAASPAMAQSSRRPVAALAGGLGAGVLTTSVSVNGPVLVLTLSHLGLRGAMLRDSLAAALLGLSALGAVVVIAFSGADQALPQGWVLLACIPALLIGHRFGAAVFRRLDDGSHHRATLAAAGIAGVLSIVAALL